MKKILFSIFLISIVLSSCKTENKEITAQEIIDKSIEVSNVNKLSNASMAFNFRDKHYKAKRNSGSFELKRKFVQDEDTILDVLSNEGFIRHRNNAIEQIPDSMAIKYTESVNSVHYFSVLPLGLNDKAVIKKRLEDISIKGKDYYKIQVTFQQEGGGVDFEDVFVYWFDKENYNIDYLAYLFHVNGGGVRFREVIKEHIIDGVRIVDYANYKPLKNILVEDTDKAFINEELEKVSEINLEDISIK